MAREIHTIYPVEEGKYITTKKCPNCKSVMQLMYMREGLEVVHNFWQCYGCLGYAEMNAKESEKYAGKRRV